MRRIPSIHGPYATDIYLCIDTYYNRLANKIMNSYKNKLQQMVAKLYQKSFEILILILISFIINEISLTIYNRCWCKFKNSDQFSFNTQGITIIHWIFDVSIIIANHCWRHGGIELKSKIGFDSHLILEQ